MLNMLRLKANSQAADTSLAPAPAALEFGPLPKELFLRMLWQERKRTERSGRRFVLMLLDPGRLLRTNNRDRALKALISALSESSRDTDLVGWYGNGPALGVIFTEVGPAADGALVNALSTKVREALYRTLTVSQVNEISLTFHIFPEDWSDDSPGGPVNSSLHLSLAQGLQQNKVALQVKRMIDIVGSLAALILCLPVLIVIAIAIKATSKGPILFRQTRLGQYGRKFTFLKFRSMYFKNDSRIHEQYVKQFIAGSTSAGHDAHGHQRPYKLVADPRITAVGGFLRKSSLDELPQLLNVLKGEMSLVGPRPPLTYEYECYDLWHKQRLLAAKPGITGLWQVVGRSKVKFDDMVRLDIQYSKAWSLWLDIKLLLQTPLAVVSGDGAR